MQWHILQTVAILAILASAENTLELPASLSLQHQSLSTAARSFSAINILASDVSAPLNSAKDAHLFGCENANPEPVGAVRGPAESAPPLPVCCLCICHFSVLLFREIQFSLFILGMFRHKSCAMPTTRRPGQRGVRCVCLRYLLCACANIFASACLPVCHAQCVNMCVSPFRSQYNNPYITVLNMSDVKYSRKDCWGPACAVTVDPGVEFKCDGQQPLSNCRRSDTQTEAVCVFV